MKKTAMIGAILACAAGVAAIQHETSKKSAAAESVAALSPVAMKPEGAKTPLPSGGYLVWKFSKKPQMGTVVVKVMAYSENKKQEARYEITGEYGMPSMRYHDSGVKKFQLNKKNDYLLPMDIAMPGDWDIVIRIKLDGKEIFAGKIDFSV